MDFVLATVPHTGTRAAVHHLRHPDFPDVKVRWEHLYPDYVKFLYQTKATIFSTWRDPLLALMTYKVRLKDDPIPHYERLLKLMTVKSVSFIDLRFIPIVGATKSIKHKDLQLKLKELYVNRDIAEIEKELKGDLNRLRAIPWGDFPTEEWWR